MAGEYNLGELGGVLGGDLYSSLFGTQGFESTGNSNPWMQWNGGALESGDPSFFGQPNQEALDSFKDYSFNWSPTGGQGGTLTGYNPQGQSIGSFKQNDEDSFTKLMGVVAPAVASWGFGSALSPMFGGGVFGNAAAQGLTQGSMSSMQGGSFGQGALSGAISGGMNGLAKTGMSPSSLIGLDKGTLANMFNRGVGSTLGSLVSGKSGSEALQNGLLGAGLSGINSLGTQGMSYVNQLFNTLNVPDMGAGSDSFNDLEGSMGNPEGQTDVSPNRYDEYTTGSDGMSSYNPEFRYGGDQVATSFGTPKQVQSFSFPTLFSNTFGGLGDYAKNNLGDLATTLYGIYNNRRQQRALGDQLNSLQGLYSANSPYAQQLRNTLNAKAAQTGRRSNIAGRETQLQAALADRYAQLQPSMLKINQARGQLQNSMGSNTLSMLNRMGAFKGLAGLFGGQQPDYNAIGLLEGQR